MKCAELILQDHATLRRGLDILDGMVNNLERGLRIEISDVTTILKFLRRFGTEYHQSVEEDVLFPILLRSAPDNSVIQRMASEHEWQRNLIADIEQTLKSKKAGDFLRASRRLTMLLRNHCNEEDALLGNIIERCLSKEEDQTLAAEFEKRWTEQDIDVNLSRLESKYAPRPLEKIASAQRALSVGQGAYAP